MKHGHEKETPIPKEWRTVVIAILRSGDKSRIFTTQQADRDWGATCPNAWLGDRHKAMADALERDEISGRHIINMEPPCDTYEFWFLFDERRFLGKIGLRSDGRLIIIFSSHIPRKGEDRL